MNIETLKQKKGTVYRARVGSEAKRISKVFTRKIDAQRWIMKMQTGSMGTEVNSSELQQLGRAREVSQPSLPEAQSHLNFPDLFQRFQENYANVQQEPGTRIREKIVVEKHLTKYFSQIDVSRIKREDIQQYLHYEARRGKLKPATINKHFQVIHKVFAWGVKNGLVELNPAAGVVKLPMKDSVYSPDFKFLEVDEIYPALTKAGQLYPKEFPVILTAAMTGLRLGEVCALRRKDLLEDVDSPAFLVRRTYCRTIKDFKDSTKGGKARVVPVSDQLLEILRPLAQSKSKNDLLFFEDQLQAAVTRNTLHKKWTRVQRLCGIEPRPFHALRHTFATLFLSHGGSPFALQRILGHSNAKITDKYSHFSKSMHESSRNVVQFPAQPKSLASSG